MVVIASQLADEIRAGLAALADPGRAPAQQAYMKSAMPYRGVRLPDVRRVVRGALRPHAPLSRPDVEELVAALWDDAAYREDRYAALEALTLAKHRVHRDTDMAPLVRRLIVEGAWWDITDGLSGVVGELLRFPDAKATILAWADDDNLWLRRAAIIAQLHLRADVDTDMLTYAIDRNAADKEFFIRKAIGWALRDYAYHDPDWVRRFVASRTLSPLSVREATKHLAEAADTP